MEDFIDEVQEDLGVPLFSKHNFTKMVDDKPVRVYYNPYNMELQGIENKTLADFEDDILVEFLKEFIDETLYADVNSKEGVLVDKSVFEVITGIHLTHSQFMEAMLECGFAPVNPSDFIWHYRVSLDSPFFFLNKIDDIHFRDHKFFEEVYHLHKKYKEFSKSIKLDYEFNKQFMADVYEDWRFPV